MPTEDSHVRLHPLRYRKDGDEWLVGRPDTGCFVAVPTEAVTFLGALSQGDTVRAARQCVADRDGIDIDGLGFVDTLLELGFIAAVDGDPLGSEPVVPSLPWLRAQHVRCAFTRPVAVAVALFLAAGTVAFMVKGHGLISFHAYFITGRPAVDLAWNTAMLLATIAIHEFWHLAAARVDDVPARIGLGTRLQFLVAQTTVTGLWGASRTARIRVYTVGLLSDLVIASAASLALLDTAPDSLAARCLRALVLSLLLSVAQQFAFFMRTDVYFVVQELLHCKNLYHDAMEHLQHLWLRLTAAESADPTLALPEHERLPVRAYAVFMAVGSAFMIAVFVGFDVPILVSLFAKAYADLLSGIRTGDVIEVLDGAAVFALEGTLQVLFCVLSVRKNGPKVVSAVGGLTAGIRRLRRRARAVPAAAGPAGAE